MTDAPTIYRVAFSPLDENIHPDECYAPTYHPSRAAAAQAIAEDCMAEARCREANDHEAPEWNAYMIAACDALITGGTAEQRVHVVVTTGDNPRPIGTYWVMRVSIGHLADCTHCGDFRGVVTELAADGSDFIACCEDCAADFEMRFPDEVKACHKCGATEDLDTTPNRPTTCHACALDDDLRRWIRATVPGATWKDDA